MFNKEFFRRPPAKSTQYCTAAVALLFLLTSAVSPAQSLPSPSASNSNKPIGDKWAVVIGISKFADPRVPGLKFSSKDARDFYDYLIDPNGGKFKPDHVRLLVDDEASKVNIMDTLGDSYLPHAASPDDLVVIYFSTHGSPAGADIRGVSYVVAYDTQVDKLFATGLEMRQLLRTIKERTHTNRVVLLLDTCYSGAGADESHKGILRKNVDTQEMAQGIGSLVISSSSADQRAWESDQLRNSYFTRYLIDSLKQDSGKIALTRAFASMKDQVQTSVLKDKGELQTPVIAGHFNGPDLVISTPATVTHPAPQVVPLTGHLSGSNSGKSFTDGIAEYVEHMRNAHAYIDQHKLWEASHELAEATKLNPSSVEAFLVYADVLDEQQRYSEALEAAKRSVINNENSSEAHERLGRAYLRSGAMEDALRQAQKSITIDPTNSMAHNLLGMVHKEKFNKIDLAEQEYRKSLELNPLNVRAMVNLGALLEKKNHDFAASEALYRQALQADSGDAPALLALGRVLLQQNKTKDAETYIRKALEIDAANPNAHCELGNILAATPATLDQAEQEYRKAIELAPKNGYAHFVFGRFLVDDRGRYEEGENELKTALELDSTLDEAHVRLADLIIEKRKAYDRADEEYKKAIALNPRNAQAHLGLAKIQCDLFHNYPQAQDELQKAIAINPGYSDAYLQLGLLLDQKMGRWEEAQQQYKKAIAADPKNAYAHYYLGMLFLERNKTKTADETVSEIKQAIAIDPTVSIFHTKLGWLLSDKYKNHKEAKAEFQQAIDHNITDCEAHYRLGMLLIEKFGERKAGARELKTAVEQSPGDRDIKAAFDRFGH